MRNAPSILLAHALAFVLPACSAAVEGPRPNVLLIVWDTVRADRTSLYGHDVPTTPFLEELARGGLVFDDCVSTACWTVPSHAAMFTGLLPSEHGTHLNRDGLHEELDTLAEILLAAGYRTYLYSANPHLSSEKGFAQGFEREEHPWSPGIAEDAERILLDKLHPSDRSSELPERLRGGDVRTWDVKASGRLAWRGLRTWLGESDDGRPWFAFLNYMEAHRPLMPPEALRRRMMTEREVRRSYEIDRSWPALWSYTFGLSEYTDEELSVMARTYDVALRELDLLLEGLIGGLEARGELDDTIVVLTSDHGELLGEKHMLDHQYSLYEGVLRVPLVLWYPRTVAAGRVARPVVNFDLFPTVLELVGLGGVAADGGSSRSLLDPSSERLRLAEYLIRYRAPFRAVEATHPDWDPAPFDRRLRALYHGDRKLIWGSDGRHELYDLAMTPDESVDLAGGRPGEVDALSGLLGDWVERLEPRAKGAAMSPQLSEETRARLEALGYFSEE